MTWDGCEKKRDVMVFKQAGSEIAVNSNAKRRRRGRLRCALG